MKEMKNPRSLVTRQKKKKRRKKEKNVAASSFSQQKEDDKSRDDESHLMDIISSPLFVCGFNTSTSC
jgi:hypothetical protein